MKKKLIPIFLALLMVFAMMPLSMQPAYADDPVTTTIGGVVYTLNEDGTTATVSGYTGDLPSAVTIADSIIYENESYTVSEIGQYAFKSCDTLESITIPPSVTSIGDHAFRWCKVKSVTLSDGLESIGRSAFHYSGLESITIPASVTSIGMDAFSGIEALTSAVFEEGSTITTFPYELFSGCKNIKSITLPEKLVSIGDRALNGLESLESITLPETLTTIGTAGLRNCNKITTITIPASVTSIGGSAFENVPLTTVNFGGTEEQWAAITGDGKPNIDGAFNIFFTNDDGTVLQFSIVKSGETPSYQGATPTKAPDAQYKYAFAGWTPEITAVTGDATYTAIYDKTAKISIKDAKVALSATSFTYNGKVQKPIIKTIKGLTLKEGTDYTTKWSNASSKNAGTYSVTITGQGDYTGTTKATYTINKAANPLTMKPKTATVKYKKLKKKAQPLAVTKVITFTKQLKDKKTYTLSSAKKGKKSFKKYFKINKTTGKVTVKKGLKKGIYKVKVKVKAAGNSNYNPSALKTVTFKVKVK